MLEITKALFYVVFAMLFGYAILSLVPKEKKPVLKINKQYILIGILLIPVLAIAPIISISYYISINFDAPFITTFFTVLTGYKVGQGWLVTFILSFLLLGVHLFVAETYIGKLSFFLSLFTVALSASWASHATSLSTVSGFIGNSLHFLAATIWLGVLLVVSIFSTSSEQWSAFVKWFSPLAFASVSVLVLSGLFLMEKIVPEYINSWVLTYGQWLLLKHLLFIPILVYGVSHSFLLKRKLHHARGSIVTSLRTQSIIGISIFVTTAFMTEAVPPHEVARTLQSTEPSRLFEWVAGFQLTNFNHLSFSVSWLATVLFGISMFLLYLLFRGVWAKKRLVYQFTVTAGFLAVTYLALMQSIQMSGSEWVEQGSYSSMEEAIAAGYTPEDHMSILLEESDNSPYVVAVYVLNEEKLVAEMLLKEEDTYYRLTNATLTIGGTPVYTSDYKIRTFLIRDGVWLQDDKEFTYVTLGYISNPPEVEAVRIIYEGDISETDVNENAFINMTSSNEEWQPNHPIEFLDEKKNVVGGYMRGIMEDDVYCH